MQRRKLPSRRRCGANTRSGRNSRGGRRGADRWGTGWMDSGSSRGDSMIVCLPRTATRIRRPSRSRGADAMPPAWTMQSCRASVAFAG
jgi:hypothetical protein